MSTVDLAQSVIGAQLAQNQQAIQNTVLKQAIQQDQQVLNLVQQAVDTSQSSSPTAPGVGGLVDKSA